MEERNETGRDILRDQRDREDKLCDLAVSLAEKQLVEGTASAQVITHFLKLASTKERLERQLIEKQIAYTGAKVDVMTNPNAESEKYEEVLAAMKKYSGNGL